MKTMYKKIKKEIILQNSHTYPIETNWNATSYSLDIFCFLNKILTK